MNFLTPLALTFAALSIPIILLYMLKLRRQDVLVSSTLLWQRLLRDREANAPWQRLRRNLLLLLQLLILALLTLALARPFIPTPTVVVDLYKTTYIDTPGLSILYELKQELAAKGRSLLLQNPSRCVLRMLNITRMYRIFPYRNTSTDVEMIPAAKSGAPPPPENLNIRAKVEKHD